MVRIKEVTHDLAKDVVFDLSFFDYANTNTSFTGYYAYRSHRIPDLYSTLPVPVEDLSIQLTGGAAFLQFSGSETRSYTIQASKDLLIWNDIGTPIDTGSGNYQFADFEVGGTSSQFYRVVTD